MVFNLMSSFINKYNISNAMTHLIIIMGALFVALFASEYSSDAKEYSRIYSYLSEENSSIFSLGRSEYLYYAWNKFFAFIGFDFKLFLFLSTVFFLSLKIFGLQCLCKKNDSFFVVVFYMLTLFLLHDAIQFKIAWALSFSVWSCVFISNKRYWPAFFAAIIGSGFHFTSVLLPITFLLCLTISSYSIKLIYLFVAAFFGYLISTHLAGFFIDLFSAIDSRYLDYSEPYRLQHQNKTGLFGIYTFLSACYCTFVYVNTCKDVHKRISVLSQCFCFLPSY